MTSPKPTDALGPFCEECKCCNGHWTGCSNYIEPVSEKKVKDPNDK